MHRNVFHNLKMPLYFKKYSVLIFFLFLNNLILVNSLLYAQNFNQKTHITYKNKLLTISVRDTDIKYILSKLSEKTSISIKYPESLKKKVTINKKEISLRKALRSLLKGLNYAMIYSAKNKNKSTILEVRVFSVSKKSRLSERAEAQIDNRIKSYERQIKAIKNNLTRVDQNSSRGKGYLNRIRFLEEKIQKLERQLY